jgi:hypothetical protein
MTTAGKLCRAAAVAYETNAADSVTRHDLRVLDRQVSRKLQQSIEMAAKFLEPHRTVLYLREIQRLRSAALVDGIVEVIASADAEFAVPGADVDGAAVVQNGHPLRWAGPGRSLELDDSGKPIGLLRRDLQLSVGSLCEDDIVAF